MGNKRDQNKLESKQEENIGKIKIKVNNSDKYKNVEFSFHSVKMF